MAKKRTNLTTLTASIAVTWTWMLLMVAGCSSHSRSEETVPPVSPAWTGSPIGKADPSPTNTATLRPTATATRPLPSPTDIPTRRPTSTATTRPTATATRQAPSPTPTEPEPTATTTPSATLSPSPSPTDEPTATPTAVQGPPYGVEVIHLDRDLHPFLAQDAGVVWMRLNALRLAAVEPSPGARNWAAVSGLEADLKANLAAGIETILIVRETPGWAQKVPGHSCGPVSPQEQERFAQFLADAVRRYRDPPFGVKYWEIGNEPDVDPSLVAPNSPYGCWGDLEATHYGGRYYGEVLQVLYPAIKGADPEAQVLIGGLLLDREPAKDPLPNPPGRFLEGILESGGGDSFDIVSYHAYLYWDPSRKDWEMGYKVWADRGGIVVGKTEFLREVLDQYGYKKPLMLTEGGLLCRECGSPPPGDFLQSAADYVPRLFIRNMELGLLGTFWYTLDGPGWQQAGLLDATQQPRPAYQALKAMTTLLEDASYAGRLDGLPGLVGYRLKRPGGEVWATWSLDGTPIALPVPTGFEQAYNLFGEPLNVGSDTIEVGFRPVYIVVREP